MGSGILNTSRQIGMSVGLSIVGAIGMGITRGRWEGWAGGSEAAERVQGSVESGEIGSAVSAVGRGAASAARSAFVDGHRSAMLAAAVAGVLAVVFAVVGLRAPAEPAGVQVGPGGSRT